MTKKQELVENANSKGYIINYYGIGKDANSFKFLSRDPNFDPIKALNVIRNDPTVKGAIVTMTDKVLEAGWTVRGIDKKSRQKELENKLKEVRFNRLIRQVVASLVLYNNAFIEIVKKGDALSDLNLLETTLTKVSSLDNGDVIDYFQQVAGQEKEWPRWKPDKVVHIKIDEITTGIWSDLAVQSLYDTVLLKDSIRQWLAWFFETNQMKGLYSIKSASSPKVKEFMSYLKASERDPTKPIICEGEVLYQALNNFDAGTTILEVIRWCDEQILEALHASPISVGIADASGRSNSSEQGSWVDVRVNSIHKVLEEYFTYDLFPKIGFEKNEFSFGVLDTLLMSDLLDNVQKMRNSQFTEEAILEFLRSQGVVFEAAEVLKNPEEIAAEQAEQQASMKMDTNKGVGTGKEGSIGNKSADAAPSRMRQSDSNLSTANRKQVVQNAESEEAKIKEEDVLTSNKVVSPFSKFPYSYSKKD